MSVRMASVAVANEVYKGLLHAWAERAQIVLELPLFIVFFLLISAVFGRGEQIAAGRFEWSFDSRVTSLLFVGYMGFMYFYLHTAKLFWRLLGEIQAGTIEQVYLSPLPSWLIAIAGRVAAAVLETLIVVGATYLVVSLLVEIRLAWSAAAAVPLLFLVIGSIGYSLVIGGLTLLWKRIEMINEMLLTVVAIFSGAFVPLDQLPDWMAAIGRLFPISHAIASLRGLLIDGRPVTTFAGDGGLIWVVSSGVLWLVVGVLFFAFGELTAKREGSLSRY